MIVADASLAIKLVIEEVDSPRVRALWLTWLEVRDEVIVPPIFWPESISGVRRAVYRGLLAHDDGDRAAKELQNLPISTREPWNLYLTAWQLADQLNRPTIYDCCYLALGTLAGCEVWTADQRLVNAVGATFPLLRQL